MASVSNVVLAVQKGGEGSRRKVTVTYKICFSECEALAGSVFLERVALRGDDPVWDDNLATLRNACVKAQRGCVDRTVSAFVSRRTLDEDGDTVIFGVPIFADTDELYAKVELTPFAPLGSTGSSNIVTGQFGAAGSD